MTLSLRPVTCLRIAALGAPILLGVALIIAPAASPLIAQSETFQARTAAFMEADYGGSDAGAAIMVLDGEEAWLAGYGMADIEWRQAVTAQTSFRLGSISKPLTALAVLQLADAGRLDLDQPIGQVLETLPEQLGRPTSRDLLSHMSGLPDHFALPQIPQIMRNPISPRDIIALMAEAELQFEPGTQWSYSNFNYVLLASIVAAVDPQGRSYSEYLDQEIFAPAGMVDAHYDTQPAIIARRASGYDHDGSSPINTITADPSLAHGAGSLMASAADLLALTRALRDERLLPEPALRQAWRSMVDSSGDETGYGLGFNVGEFLGERAVWHTGSTHGFQSVWIVLPDSRRAIAILSNGYYLPNVTTAARRILADLAGQPVPAFEPHPIVQADWRSAQGRYRLADGRLLQLHAQDGVRFNIEGGRWNELSWGGGALFFRPDTLTHLRLGASSETLTYVTSQLVTQTAVREPGRIEGAVISIPLDPEESRELVGQWVMTSGDVFTIRLDRDSLTLQLPGQAPAALSRSAPGSYFQRNAPISLSVTEPGRTLEVNLYGNIFVLQRPG